MAKTKRYNGEDGSMTDEEASPGAPENDSNAGMAEARAASDAAEAAPKKQSFKEAFASARKAGDKTFEWNGKKFTTEMAGEKKAAPKAAAAPKAEPSKPKMNILEEAKEGARRRYAASQAVAEANRPKRTPTLASKGPGMGALTGMKDGGGVKGWGSARGARKAKIY